MSKPKSTNEKDVTKRIELIPVSVDITDRENILNLPSGILEGAEIYGSELPPSPTWETPGEYIEGFYCGMKEDVGKNHQRLYILMVGFHVKNKEIAVWGSTSLDERMKLAQPNKGDHIIIVYTGNVDTQRKQ